MNCPYCHQEHPDTFLFCPITGHRLQAKAAEESVDACPDTKTFSVGDTSFNMKYVPAGSYQMGADVSFKAHYGDELPIHQVQLSRAFYIGETVVTQGLWYAVTGENPSQYNEEKSDFANLWKQLPVERVSWDDCQLFLSKLNKLTGLLFRLPTEAEWEYAARGGNQSQGYLYSGSNNPDEVAWHSGNSRNGTHPVAKLKPNELGLYDMSGNVWEWCLDWYGKYSAADQTDPTGPANGVSCVFRGGGWNAETRECRSTCRNASAPDRSRKCMGLRLVLPE